MTDQPSWLTHQQAKLARQAVGERLAGEFDGDRQQLEDVHRELDLARGSVMVPFTEAEIMMLLIAIENGAEAVLQRSSGNSPAQQRAFAKAANRLIDAVGAPNLRF